MSDLSVWRAEFDSLQNCHYLISNSLGAMPNKARDMANAYVDMWSSRGVRAWEDEWWMLPRQVGDKIGDLIGAAPDTVSIHPNVTSTQAVILSCFDPKPPRDKIVMVDIEFPSILYLYQSMMAGRGTVQVVESEDGISVPMEQLLDAIDETTLLVPISSVMFRSSYIVDAKAIIDKAHSVGARVVLDVYQAIGCVELDVAALNADFVVGGCLKWLCGGPGACFLYVRPDLINELTPKLTGWLAHESPFSFDRHSMRHTTGSYRFLNGTPPIPPLYICQAGLDIIAKVGTKAIRQHSMELTAQLMNSAARHGWATYAPIDPAKRAGTVALNIENAETICNELCRRDYLVDFRPGSGIRVSAHFYNTNQEIDDLMGMIEEIRRTLE